jgi:hypothetical protein
MVATRGAVRDMMKDFDIEALALRFGERRIPRPEWTHEAHLAVGLWHVARFGESRALERLRTGIRALNESNGVPNSETEGYHETITRAYAVLLAQFSAGFTPDVPVQSRLVTLLQSPLAHRHALLSFYRKRTLMTPRARLEWVEPDVAPLSIEHVRPHAE